MDECSPYSWDIENSGSGTALAKWISLDNIGETSAGQFQRLETNPAGKALTQIGDPAIPALKDVLQHGSLRERRNAYFALNLIGSPRAKAAMRDRLGVEEDSDLEDYIQKSTKAPN
jgi:HEAT repeat protein